MYIFYLNNYNIYHFLLFDYSLKKVVYFYLLFLIIYIFYHDNFVIFVRNSFVNLNSVVSVFLQILFGFYFPFLVNLLYNLYIVKKLISVYALFALVLLALFFVALEEFLFARILYDIFFQINISFVDLIYLQNNPWIISQRLFDYYSFFSLIFFY